MAGNAVLKSVRKLVSKDRKRYQEGDYDLDLSYITDNVLAMSFPSTGLTSVWRNHIDEVHRLLNTHHADHFMIWNLSEEKYNYEKFNNQILDFPFPDHHAPPLTLLFGIVHSIDSWVQASPQNVAVVHCKGGKGRTGVVIVCWLMFSGLFPDINQAALHFARKRSSTAKGVTQPSQVRYLGYFSDILRSTAPLNVRSLMLVDAKIGPVPRSWGIVIEIFTYKENNEPELKFRSQEKSAGENVPCSVLVADVASTDSLTLLIPVGIEVSNDVLVKGVKIGKKGVAKELFHVIFHSFFVCTSGNAQKLSFKTKQLDAGSKKIPKDFELSINTKAIPSAKEVAGEKPDQFSGSSLFYSMRKQFRERTRGKPIMESMGKHRNTLFPSQETPSTTTTTTTSNSISNSAPVSTATSPIVTATTPQSNNASVSVPNSTSSSSSPTTAVLVDLSSFEEPPLSSDLRLRRFSYVNPKRLNNEIQERTPKLSLFTEDHRRSSTTIEALIDPSDSTLSQQQSQSQITQTQQTEHQQHQQQQQQQQPNTNSTLPTSSPLSNSPSIVRHTVPSKPAPLPPLPNTSIIKHSTTIQPQTTNSSPITTTFVRGPVHMASSPRRSCVLSQQRNSPNNSTSNSNINAIQIVSLTSTPPPDSTTTTTTNNSNSLKLTTSDGLCSENRLKTESSNSAPILPSAITDSDNNNNVVVVPALSLLQTALTTTSNVEKEKQEDVSLLQQQQQPSPKSNDSQNSSGSAIPQSIL